MKFGVTWLINLRYKQTNAWNVDLNLLLVENKSLKFDLTINLNAHLTIYKQIYTLLRHIGWIKYCFGLKSLK